MNAPESQHNPIKELQIANVLMDAKNLETVALGPFSVWVHRDCLPQNLGHAWTSAKRFFDPGMWPAIAYQESAKWRFLIPVTLRLPEISDPTLQKAWPIDISEMAWQASRQCDRNFGSASIKSDRFQKHLQSIDKMRYFAILQQLLAFDSAIYSARRTHKQRILLLTSEFLGHCLLERAIAIAKRKIDHLGNACEPTLISRVGSQLVLNNGSLIQYANDDERPPHDCHKYHVVFWQPRTQRLEIKPNHSATLPASVLAPGGSIFRLNQAIAQFYAYHRAEEAR